jgi:conjugal transfer pilus assembly protein TraE
VVILAVSTIICMVLAVYAAKIQKIIILPPVVDKRIVISGTNVNDDYVKLYGRYITSLLLCWHPGSISSGFSDLLSLATPEHFPELKAELFRNEQAMKKIQASSMFYPSEIITDQKNRYMIITGTRRLFTPAAVLEKEIRSYRVDYKILNGRLFINRIAEQEKK